MKAPPGSKALLILIFIVCCHTVGLLVFCKGFLLKRVVIPEYSQCSLSQAQAAKSSPSDSRDHLSCTEYPRRFKRVVWLLIDALRYDFIEYGDELSSDSVPVYRNKMPFVRDLLREKPRNAKLFRFIADPPTTTMQRLKALSTGGLPTFIDISNNFNSYEILEDNLIYQSRKNARNITFMGDDTWLGLYPDFFTKTFDYPSLNVKDLHTVDNGVISHLIPELAKKDADFVIAHFLGVDHIGHTYGPSHWTMGDKLSQLNDVLETVLTSLDEDTIVFVFGDHGMTSTGDHGGETEQETNAALLVYSSRPIFNPYQPSGRPVYQIDIVPTVAMALGIPIPFSSLGKVIPEVLLPYQSKNAEKFDKSFNNGYTGRVTEDFLTALQVNALQIQRYLMTYAQHSGDFPSDVFNSLQASLYQILNVHKSVMETQDHNPSQKELTDIATAYIGYMKEVRKMCQSVWAKFDNVSITEGLVLLLLSVVVMVPLMLIDVDISLRCLKNALPCGAVCGLAATVAVSTLVNYIHLEFSFTGILSLILTFLLYTLSLVIVVFIIFSRGDIIKAVKQKLEGGIFHLVNNLSVLQLLSVAITFLYSVAMLSNSFVLYEGDMVTFFIQSLLLCFTIRSLRVEFSNDSNLQLNKATLLRISRTIAPHVGLMVCVRIVKIFFACRDLQIQDGCLPTTFIHALPVASEFLGWLSKWRMLLSCTAVIAVPVTFVFLAQQNAGARHLNRWIHFVGKFGFPIAVLCVVGFWLLLCCSQSFLETLSHWQHVALPRMVYLISTVAVILCVINPVGKSKRVLTMSCEENPDNIDGNSLSSEGGIEREREFDGGQGTQRPRLRKQQSREDGSVGVHSSREAAIDRALHPSVAAVIPLTNLFFLVALWIPLALLLNDGLALSAVVMAAQVGLTIQSLRGKESGTSWPVCVLWALMSSQFFFGFGHQATVTSLRFEAGFVGLHGDIHKYNLPFAAVLVGLNTLGSQLLFGFGLPLLLLLDGTKQQERHSSSDRIFKIILQYITFHSVKMLLTVLAASVHRRHLMVWWVFAPRFMYEGAFQVTTNVCAILSYLFVCRLEHQLSFKLRGLL